MITEQYLRSYPDALRATIESRFADEAKAALSQFGIALRDYDIDVQTRAYGNEVEAMVELTHYATRAAISVNNLRLALDTGEITTPSHPDHEGTGMLLFP